MTTTYLNTREVQLGELEILKVFDSTCKALGLRYSLAGGTLLGAVRHRGFIPWDDDVDVCMPRPDYERFLKCADMLPAGYSVVTMDNSAWCQPFAKVQWHAFRAQEPFLEGVMDEYLWLDIFPFDGVPSDKAKHRDILKRLIHLRVRLSRSVYRSPKNATLAHKFLKAVYRLLFGSPRQVGKTKQKINEAFSELDYESASEVFCYCSNETFSVPKADFDNLVELPFEGLKFPCVANYDAHLTLEYGDYMQLPPEDQRVTHGMKVWRAE